MGDERVRPLMRVRQVREFTDEPVDPSDLEAIADAARWSGSSRNSQPWRFIVIRDVDTIRRIAEAGHPQTRSLRTAQAAIAIVIPAPGDNVSHAYDEGRAAERILTAASMLGMAGGIAWVLPKVADDVRQILGLPEDRLVRTVVALGHPSEAARAPKSSPGEARLPRREVVFKDHWPS
ncbi:MAG: nitroreductase family protein [Actinomycetota bacterium]